MAKMNAMFDKLKETTGHIKPQTDFRALLESNIANN